MERGIRLRATGIVDLAKLRLRGKTHDMPKINDVRRDPRHDIDAIQGESLFAIKIDIVPFHPEQQG